MARCDDCPATRGERQARRYRKALRRIGRFPDHEIWWDIAREMIGNVLNTDMSVESAEREAIAEINRQHGFVPSGDQDAPTR